MKLVRSLMLGALIVALSAVGTFALAAPSSLGDPWDEPLPTSGVLDGRDLVAAEVVGRTLLPGTEVTVSFDDGSVTINSGCNTTSASYEVRDGHLRFMQVMQTMMGCGRDQEAQDDWIAAVVDGAFVDQRRGDRLTVRRGSSKLVFTSTRGAH